MGEEKSTLSLFNLESHLIPEVIQQIILIYMEQYIVSTVATQSTTSSGGGGEVSMQLDEERLFIALNNAFQNLPIEIMPRLPFTVQTSIVAVLEHVVKCPHPRIREVLGVTTKHLHNLIKECNLTVEELQIGINFLTRVGEKCEKNRQEMVMLADSLGLTSLVQELQAQHARLETHNDSITSGALLGPYHTASK